MATLEVKASSAPRAPRALAHAVLLIAGAALLALPLYLLAVRGQALLLDLASLSQRVFCF
jgi:hypothetical protein